jgi:hypothetical protein
MAYDDAIARYRRAYAKLLRVYSKPYYERFGDEMEQTFNDLLRERAGEKRGLFGYALWMFVDTSVGIIKENSTLITIRQKNMIRIVLATAFILLIPAVAMQFTDQVVWNLADFAIAGALLLGAGLTYELVARDGPNAYRAAVGLAVAAALILVWVNLAVGLIASEESPANLLYGGVLVVGIIGAIIARLRPHGMARALFATALAQVLVPVIALMIWKPEVSSAAELMRVFGMNVFLAMLFVLSALLFRRAGGIGPSRVR